MKTLLTLLILCMSSVVSLAQSIQYVYSSEARRNGYVVIEVYGKNTQFLKASSLTITFESAIDGSIFTATDVVASSNIYCTGTFKIPATAQTGSYHVSITTAIDGQLVLPYGFEVNYDPPYPEITNLSQTMATRGDHVAMTVSVQYAQFLSTPEISLFIAGNSNFIVVNSVVALNDTTLEVIFDIPLSANSDTCAVQINSGIDYIIKPSAFIIQGLNPDIVAVSPNSGTHGTHVDLTINTTQTMFTTSTNTAMVLINEEITIWPTSMTYINDTVLIASFDLPQRVHSGVFDVAMTTGGAYMYEFGSFTMTGFNPVLTGVSPAQSAQGQTVDITVSGTEMYFTAGYNLEFILLDSSGFYVSAAGNALLILNDNQIKAKVVLPKQTPIGLYTVFVIVDEDTSELQSVFTVVDDGMLDPKIISVSPKTTQRGQLVDLTIDASGSKFMQTSNIDVFLAGMYNHYKAIAVTVLSDTQLKCTFFLSAFTLPELYSVEIFEDNNTRPLVLRDAFTITRNAETDPALVSLSSSTAYPGQQFGVTITGFNTHFDAPDLAMIFYSDSGLEWTPDDFTVTSSTSITAQFHFSHNFPLGIYHLKVYSSGDGLLELKDALMVNAVGLDEETGLIGKLYPNPVHDNLYIDTKHPIRACSIVDITGKQTVVDPNEFKQATTHLIIPIDKLGLRKGIYFVRLDSEDGFDYRKFVVE